MILFYLMQTCILTHERLCESVPPSPERNPSLGPASNQQRQLPSTDHKLGSKERCFSTLHAITL